MDADAVAAVYADDAIEMPPNEPAVAGKSAVADKYASFFEQGVGADAFTVTSVEIDGMEDVAFDRGTWSWTGTPPGMSEPMTDSGKYMAIARRQEDGAWLWTAVIWNSDLPLPEAE
jgi:ketosteroid isomerase-like protein